MKRITRAKILRTTTALLGLTAAALALALMTGLISKAVNRTDTVSESDADVISASDIEAVATATPTPQIINVTENLETDQIVEDYFGPLPELTQYTECEHVVTRAIYIGAACNLENNLELCDNSELNAVVIDLKESTGVYFDSTNELAWDAGYVTNAYNLSDVVEECHEHDVRVIGRIVCFKDPTMAEQMPDRAICDEDGNVLYFTNEGDKAFMSPYNTDNWDYLIDLALEAIGRGVDEIQFDYIRFPTGDSTTGAEPYFGEEGTVPTKVQCINRFLQTARRRIQDTYGVPVSCDTFGIAFISTIDGDILGQDTATIGLTGCDSMCPMIYPSHYALGTILNGHTYETPDTEPYGVTYDTLINSMPLRSDPNYCLIRPYLQAFTASYLGSGKYISYGYDEINAEIAACQDAGVAEFVLWDPDYSYEEGLYGGNRG